MNNTIVIKVNRATIENGNAEMLLNEVKAYLSNRPSEEVFQELKDKFSRYLLVEGFSRTLERLKVLEKICVENAPFTFNTIHSRVLKDMYVSLRTVNNTFKLLVDANIIRRIDESKKNELFKTTYFEIVK